MGNENVFDSKTRTPAFVKQHADRCGEALLVTLDEGKDALSAGDYAAAAAAFADVVVGLKRLAAVDPAAYGAPLYANQYAAARIYLFGLHDLKKGLPLLRAACESAKKCGAANDRAVMADVLSVLEKRGIEGALDAFDIAFPDDLLG